MGDLKGFLKRHTFPANVTSKELQARNHVRILTNACMENANNPTGQRKDGGLPQWFPMSSRFKRATLIKGTTYWINDYMAVGHAMYDTQLLSVLTMSDLHVDRIILQRAPCATFDLCNKNGGTSVYDSFFKGYYGTLLGVADSISESGTSPVNIYIRFRREELYWKAMPIRFAQARNSNTTYAPDRVPPIRVQPVLCFEKVLHRTTNKGFFYSISMPMVRKFKQFASKLANDTLSGRTPCMRERSRKLCVTVVGRGANHARHMSNEGELLGFLNYTLYNKVGDMALEVEYYDSGKASVNHFEQVMVSAESDIVITTHGAFEANVIYMPDDALLLEIRGEEEQYEREGNNFRGLAHTHAVHYRSVKARNLMRIKQPSYSLEKREMQEIADIMLDYINFMLKVQVA